MHKKLNRKNNILENINNNHYGNVFNLERVIPPIVDEPSTF